MWRSSVAQSLPGLLSRLRRPAAVPGIAANPRILARAYSTTRQESDSEGPEDRASHAEKRMSSSSFRRCCSCCSLCGPKQQSRRHLYVALEEMKTGFSLYKLNVHDLDGGDEDAVTATDDAAVAAGQRLLHRLPQPVLRLGYHTIGSKPHVESLGSKIVVMGGGDLPFSYRGSELRGITFVYDTETARLDAVPPVPGEPKSTGNKLYALPQPALPAGKAELADYLYEAPVEIPLREYYDPGSQKLGIFCMRGQIHEWTWKTIPSPLPLDDRRGWCTAHAVHPDGRTVFVSASFTFSLDSELGEWTRHGDWCLPFNGRAYYDGDLDAWVGTVPEDKQNWRWDWEGRHYLCSCDVPALGGEGPTPEPTWKQSKEPLSFLEAPLVAGGRALVHTGRGRFCLVEAAPLPVEDGEPWQRVRCIDLDGMEMVLHVTMFRAKHGKNGELVATPCRPGRSYVVPNYACYNMEPPRLHAFWM